MATTCRAPRRARRRARLGVLQAAMPVATMVRMRTQRRVWRARPVPRIRWHIWSSVAVGVTPVRQVMTTPLHTVPADSTLGEVMLAMVDRGIHHLPLTRQGRLVGIVTDTDLLRRESHHPLLVAASSTGRPAPRSWPATPVR
jgi:CBS domain-containing protein